MLFDRLHVGVSMIEIDSLESFWENSEWLMTTNEDPDNDYWTVQNAMKYLIGVQHVKLAC
jgi:hypothetical protein